MHVLITGSSYAPEETGIAPYTTGFAEHLVERGHDVTVITGMPSYPQWQVYPEYRGAIRMLERRGGVTIHRIRGYVPRRQSTWRRGLFEASFLLGGLTAARMPRPDVVLGVVPALGGGVLASMVARRFGRPFGLIFQDVTAPAAAQSGVAGGGRAVGAIRAVEGWTARGASAIGIIAEGFRPYLRSLGVDATRIRRVRNWMHIEEPKLGRATVRRQFGWPEDAVVCLHAGNMGAKQGLTNIIECARLAVAGDPRFLFVLMGDGNQRPQLVDTAERYRLPNVRFLPIQPPERFSGVLAAADLLLVNQLASVVNMSLPSKLTSYFSSGRPVLAAVAPESETAMEIRSNDTGVLVPPDRPEMLLQAVRDLAADPVRQERVAAAGQRYARTVLSAAQALHDLETLVETAVASPGGREPVSAR